MSSIQDPAKMPPPVEVSQKYMSWHQKEMNESLKEINSTSKEIAYSLKSIASSISNFLVVKKNQQSVQQPSINEELPF